MVEEFKSFYLKLSENFQNMVNNTILRMKKTHKKKLVKKMISIKAIIDFYLRKKNLKVKDLMDMCYEVDEKFSEDTYKSIIKRNVVNIKNNRTIMLISKLLEIPSDKNGNLYIEFDTSEKLQIGNIQKRRFYTFTNGYISYLTEFQTNSVYDNFSSMSIEDQRAILYLTKALYYNQVSPDLFIHSETTDEYL